MAQTLELPLIATALSVNVNKVALLRNSRHLGIPSVLRAAQQVLAAGAQGITVHPRPDERHIRGQDVHELAALMKDWPDREFNIEGNPSQNLLGFVETYGPHQCTYVPDGEDQFTSDHGWQLEQDAHLLAPLITRAKACGTRVSLFVDPVPAAMSLARALGADRVELYTEPYANAFANGDAQTMLSLYAATAKSAFEAGLGVNAGHDLNQHNLGVFLRQCRVISEVSIGHAFVADALELGYSATVLAYLAAMGRDPVTLNSET
jgi:pyridoxine 5-phosphate synthase